MQIKQISEHVWSLRIWMVIPVTVWIVKSEDGVLLVDAGVPMMAKGISKFIEKLQAGPLKAILLTHGHSDHVGAIQRIMQAHPVPVFAHTIEIPYMAGELPYPRRKKAAVSLAISLVQPLASNEQGGLLQHGVLQPYLTPGHSPGHVAYYHAEDSVLLAGDMFTSKRGRLRRPMPMFTADMDEAVRSAALVGRLKPKHLEVCHGNPVLHPADQVADYMKNNRSRNE